MTSQVVEGTWIHMGGYGWFKLGAKKITFTAFHPDKLKLAFPSPDAFSTSLKSFLMSRIDFTLFTSKNITCLLWKLKTKFTSPIAKSTSPGLLNTTFFVRCLRVNGYLSTGYCLVVYFSLVNHILNK